VYNDQTSPEQRAFAASLGVTLPEDATKELARQMIDNADATSRQFELAEELGLTLPANVKYGRANQLIGKVIRHVSRQVITKKAIKVGDVLRLGDELWLVANIFEGFKLSMRPIRVEGVGHSINVVQTGRGKVFTAFTFRDAEKVRPQDLRR
jgi:hypothetical protein